MHVLPDKASVFHGAEALWPDMGRPGPTQREVLRGRDGLQCAHAVEFRGSHRQEQENSREAFCSARHVRDHAWPSAWGPASSSFPFLTHRCCVTLSYIQPPRHWRYFEVLSKIQNGSGHRAWSLHLLLKRNFFIFVDFFTLSLRCNGDKKVGLCIRYYRLEEEEACLNEGFCANSSFAVCRLSKYFQVMQPQACGKLPLVSSESWDRRRRIRSQILKMPWTKMQPRRSFWTGQFTCLRAMLSTTSNSSWSTFLYLWYE